MGERHSEFERSSTDWYVEPVWSVEILKARVPLIGDIHDPCCGMGTIPTVMQGTGADVVDRGYGFPARDYLKDWARYDNIVTNPPYGIAQEIIEHALETTRWRVCALVQTKFLASQRRHKLFTRDETEKVIMLSRRPSMPPGELLEEKGEIIRGNGSIDFCWVIWCRGNTAATVIDWAK
jgi:hypothetical protein